jgi:hypothetical protein
MLPGFRFLFAAILLSTSILVFGVGAAALLRATHEEFVVNPSWRNQPQEQEFARATTPVLAVLRPEPITSEHMSEPEPAPSLRDQVPTIGLPPPDADQSAEVTPDTLAQADKTATETPPAAPVQQAALAAADSPAPAADSAAPASEDKRPAADAAAATPAPASEPQQAAVSTPAPVETTAPALAAATPTTTAALGDATVSADKTSKAKAKAASPAPEKVINRAHPPKKRHRVVRRPPPPPVQQTLDPFGMPQQSALTTRSH